jgi:paraquat-inducible protein A
MMNSRPAAPPAPASPAADATGAVLIACQECDLLQEEIVLPPGGVALCSRCKAQMYRSTPHGLERALVCTISSTILFLMANAFPIIGLELQKTRNATTLFGSVYYLYQHGLGPVAALVLATTIVVPTIELASMLYILLPLRLGHVVRGLPQVFRVVQLIHPWGMVEVFMLGIIVSIVRVSNFATVEPGLALWSFAALMLMLTASAFYFNERDLWACVKAHSPAPAPMVANTGGRA